MIKKLGLLFLVLYTGFGCASQEDDDIDGTQRTIVYEFTMPTMVQKCKDVNGEAIEGSIRQAPPGYVFYYNGTRNDSVVIQFRTFDTREINRVLVYETISDSLFRKKMTWKISRADFETRARKRYSTVLLDFKNNVYFTGSGIAGGVLLLPYKIRPRIRIGEEKRGFDFSKDISLGVSGGLKHRLSRYKPVFLNALINAGISDVTMDPYNTLNTLDEARNVPAMTVATGFVLDLKRIQLGTFLGWDYVSDQNKNNWIYQGRPWFSIGLGFTIFSVSTAPAAERNDIPQKGN